MEIQLTNQPGDRQRLLRALEEFAAEHRLAAAVRQGADLALEEHVTNICIHGSEAGKPVNIRVKLAVERECFSVEVEDDGPAFNPLTRPEVDISLPLEQRPLGGLGIHLIKKFMDELDYRREGGWNIFTMRKRLA